MSRFHELTVADIRQETRDAVSIAFSLPEAERDTFLRFQPGQHLVLRTLIDGEEVMRTYSICSAPDERELRVAVKRQPHGRFSSFANERLKPGDVLQAMPPSGHFSATFEASNRKHYLAFAAGSGITPIISLIKSGLAAEPNSRFTLVYGNRSAQNMIFREQLEDLKNAHMGRFNLVPVMSREQTDVALFHGRIGKEKCDALFEHWIDVASVDECYICGPESMVESVAESLKAHGVAEANIHFELFTTPGEAKRRQEERQNDTTLDHSISLISVRIDGNQLEFELPKNSVSLLEAGLRAGVDLPHSCKGGVCSTCRARIVEGEVEMDVNYALEDYELEAGYVLTCQSYPVSQRVVVDYDE